LDTPRRREGERLNPHICECGVATPKADPEDCLPDLVVIEDVGLPEVLAFARADHLDNDIALHARAREVRMGVEPSGLCFTPIPRALKVIVGHGYSREG